MAYRGNVCNKKESPRVNWTIAKIACKKLYGENQCLNSKDEKVISFLRPLRDKQTDIVAYKGNVCNEKESLMVHWVIYAIFETDRYCGL